MGERDDTMVGGMDDGLEARVTAYFSEDDAMTIWGDAALTSTDPGLTIKAEDEVQTIVAPPNASADPSPVTRSPSENASVVFSTHSDGSASMSMPGSTVTISPRKLSITSGAEYEVGEVLGKGGMGVVNAARQASLDRRIVVKSIRPEFAGKPDIQEKFITEALATGSLDHPNVVPIHDMGVSEDGKLFYVMKEVRGKSWQDALKDATEAENIDILLRVCDAIACAHDRGVIHRDLKPDNVMLGDYGEVLVMDWGLAAAIAPTAKAAHLTDAVSCAGTPVFMAPEMARGLTHDLGPWSDQYLLGAILFTIIVGKPPHPGKSVGEVLRNAANNLIIPPTRRDEWMTVALRAMHTLPHKRYPSVKAFQSALRNCRIHHESIVLAAKGDEELARAVVSGDHNQFTRAINAYDQALALWSENAAASAKLAEARYAYAENALNGGDYGLVMSLLGESEGEREVALAAEARRQAAIRDARRKRVYILGVLAALLLVLVAVVSGVSYVIISRQAEAERQARSEADRQRNIADVRREEAERALREAELARAAEARATALRLREQEAKLAAEEQARQRAEEALRAREEIQRLGYLEDNSRWRFGPEEARERQQAAAQQFGLPVEMELDVPGAPIAMRLIPPGYYVMGSPPRDPSRNNDEYLHEVEISKPVHFSVTEITRRQWQAVVGVERLEDLGLEPGDEVIAHIMWRLRPVSASMADLPATGVSYDDVVKLFLPRLSRLLPEGVHCRLPTEAEWEWAARAGGTGHYYAGDTPEALARSAWYDANSYGRAQPVGGREPNAWGMHDIIGNVWEINMDAYDSLYYLRSPRTNPVNIDPDVDVRVTRGGSYINSPRLCRMSYRGTYMHRANRYPHAGFRLAYATWDVEEDILREAGRQAGAGE